MKSLEIRIETKFRPMINQNDPSINQSISCFHVDFNFCFHMKSDFPSLLFSFTERKFSCFAWKTEKKREIFFRKEAILAVNPTVLFLLSLLYYFLPVHPFSERFHIVSIFSVVLLVFGRFFWGLSSLRLVLSRSSTFSQPILLCLSLTLFLYNFLVNGEHKNLEAERERDRENRK